MRNSALVASLFFLASGSFALNKLQVPIIFIPGYAASAPEPEYIDDFIFQRGFSPHKLNISPVYDTLISTLERAGYKNNYTLFKAAHDWRMSLAPTDGNLDGILENVTANSITEGSYSYAVNYLGFWLNRALEKHPELQYVDVVTHSTGGDLARAYIQSPAYGALYKDPSGKQRRLPKIRNLILGAMPYFGTAHSFRPWGGDFQDVLTGFIPTTEIEGRLTALAFVEVIDGATVFGPDYNITLESILREDSMGQIIPDPTTFFRLYTPMRRSLMATYNFLYLPNSSVLTNVYNNAFYRAEAVLDLNATSSPGNNPWLKKIGTPSGQGRAIATYATGARTKTSMLDFVVPGLIDANPFIETLNFIKQLSEQQGSYLPLLELLKPIPMLVPITRSPFFRIGNQEIDYMLSGDGNGAFISLIGNFSDDPLITLVQWGNGPPPSGINPEIIWSKQSGYPIYHDVFFFNPDVAAFVTSTLSGQEILPISVLDNMSFDCFETRFRGILESSEDLMELMYGGC